MAFRKVGEISTNYTSNKPNNRTLKKAFSLEGDLANIMFVLTINQQTSTTPPTYDTDIPLKVRLLAKMRKLGISLDGSSNFITHKGECAHYLHALFNTEPDFIDTDISAGSVGATDYRAVWKLRNVKVKSEKKKVYLAIELADATEFCSAVADLQINSAKIEVYFEYGIAPFGITMDRFTDSFVANTDKDVDLSEGKQLIAFIMDGYNNNNIDIKEWELKHKEISEIVADYYGYLSQHYLHSHNQMALADFENIVNVVLPKVITINATSKFTVQVSTNRDIDITKIYKYN